MALSIQEHRLVKTATAWRPHITEEFMTLFRANGMDRGNKVDYARAYFDSILDTGKPSTYYQEYHSEMWLPEDGSLSIYTLLQIRPGPRGTQEPAPPPPSDADKLLLGKNRPGFGILEPRAYGEGVIQEWNPSQGYIGRPTKVLPKGRPAPPKWSEMYPLQVPYMPDATPGKNFSMTTKRNKKGEIVVNRTNRRAPTYHPYLTLNPEFSDLQPTPAGNWRRKHAPTATATAAKPTSTNKAETVTLSSDSENETAAAAEELEKLRKEDFLGWNLVTSKKAKRQAKKVAQEMSKAKARLEKMNNFSCNSETDSGNSTRSSQESPWTTRMDSPSPPPTFLQVLLEKPAFKDLSMTDAGRRPDTPRPPMEKLRTHGLSESTQKAWDRLNATRPILSLETLDFGFPPPPTPPSFHELLQQVEVDLVTPSNSETEEEISTTSKPSTGSEQSLEPQDHGNMDQTRDRKDKAEVKIAKKKSCKGKQ